MTLIIFFIFYIDEGLLWKNKTMWENDKHQIQFKVKITWLYLGMEGMSRDGDEYTEGFNAGFFLIG